MFYISGFLLLCFELTVGYSDHAHWKLAFNLNSADGHNFGYEAVAWEDENDVGTDDKAFLADYKSYDVTTEIANFIAIVRHQNGVCDIARVWEFKTQGKALRDYLKSDVTNRLLATSDNYTYSSTSATFVFNDRDTIFGIDGGLTFNWVYGDNGVRIGNSKTYCKDGLPAASTNDDSYHGLGNEFWIKSNTGYYWFDVGEHQGCCFGNSCKVQGSDHGTKFLNGKVYGQYAIYISDEAHAFPCKDHDLQISYPDAEFMRDFDLIDRGETGYISFEEFVFDMADINDDGVLSFVEYSDARADGDFGDTVTVVADVLKDFSRVDRDDNTLLTFNEVLFDTFDTDKDGMISPMEYSHARADNTYTKPTQTLRD